MLLRTPPSCRPAATFAAPVPLEDALTPSSGASTPASSLADEDVVLKRELDALTAPELLFGASGTSPDPFLLPAAPLALGDVAPLDLNRHQPAVIGADADADDELDDSDALFGAYLGGQQPLAVGAGNTWDYYYARPAADGNAAATAAPTGAAPRFPAVDAVRAAPAPARRVVKRAFDSLSTDGSVTSNTPSASPRGSPTAAVANSMIAMRQVPQTQTQSLPVSGAVSVPSSARSGLSLSSNSIDVSVKREAAGASGPASKKPKVSRERQLKINAASRRCRKKQKLELQFLRTHVVELQAALREQVAVLRAAPGSQPRAARLSQLLDASVRKVDEMSSGARATSSAAAGSGSSGSGPGSAAAGTGPGSGPGSVSAGSGPGLAGASGSISGEESSSSDVNQIETDDASSVMQSIDPASGYALSEERKRQLLQVASFVRMNMSLESGSFSPEVISCLPIEMDGWQLRLAITDKNYTIHNAKFFPCAFTDMYDFCWETNVAQKISIKHGRKHYVVVTPLAPDVAHVYSKTTGKWSLNVHGVPNVSYNSLVCRRFEPEAQRGIICQQSVLEERDLQDEDTIPWLFKRWVVFRPREVGGVQGTYVEAYRTASYATGRLIYKGHNTYDSFCEHLIRRYAESNSLLERMMARDPRFAQNFDATLRAGGEHVTVSDRMTKDLLLF